MADTTTPNYGYVQPEVGASDDTWGEKLNDNWLKADAQFKAIADLIENTVKDRLYPVGSLYFSTTNNDPADALGFGEWAVFGAGRALVGVGTADSVAWTAKQARGNATHTLSTAEMPSHAHSANPGSSTFTTSANNRGHTHSCDPPNTSTSSDTHSHTTGSAGNHRHYTVQNGDQAGDGGTLSSSTSIRRGRYDATGWYEYRLAGSGSEPTVGRTSATGSHSHSVSSDTHNHTVNISAFTSGGESANHTHTVAVNLPSFNTGSAGSGNAHNNIQPSIAVYIFERTA